MPRQRRTLTAREAQGQGLAVPKGHATPTMPFSREEQRVALLKAAGLGPADIEALVVQYRAGLQATKSDGSPDWQSRARFAELLTQVLDLMPSRAASTGGAHVTVELVAPSWASKPVH